jgi:hypothetical protein
VKRTLLAMALLVTSVFGVTGCGSDDDVPPAESRTKNFVFDPERADDPSAAIKSVAGNDFGNIRSQVDVSKSGPRGYPDIMSRDKKLDRMRDHISLNSNKNGSTDLRGPSYYDDDGNPVYE